ncbi:MAG: phage minor head protein [Eubacteriales bacterium]
MNERQLEVQKVMLQQESEWQQELKAIYYQAAADCEDKIRALSTRTDMENLKTIVYQKNYQVAIIEQLESALEDLDETVYSSMSQYLEQSYEDGFLGTLYDLQGQGIPLAFPIEQDQVIQAIQLDSKISQGLYTKLGEDIDVLKKSIQSEISTGIASGSSWNQMAAQIAKTGMNSRFKVAYNKSILIARTEAHRIQQKATLDCQYKAKEKGADIRKVWDSTMDSRTRPTHVSLDGQIREIEEEFEVGGKKAMYPGGFGRPEEDCNCRCCLLQKSLSALNEEEYTKMNGDTNQLVKIKAESYNEFKETYKTKVSGGIISGALDPDSDEADEHAIRYYGLVRSMTTDVATIAINTEFDTTDVEKVKNYLFMDTHDLGNTEVEYFAPDYEIAQSWQRLIDGKNIKEQDLILLRHELYEEELVNQGMSQAQAHILATQRYDYASAVKGG